MKKNLRRVFIIFLCISVGWTLGYLRLPYIENKQAYWIGFLACLVIVLLLISLLYIWNQNKILHRTIGKSEEVKSISKSYRLVRNLILGLVVIGAAIGSIAFGVQNKKFKGEIDRKDKIILDQAQVIDSLSGGNVGALLSGIIEDVRQDVNSDSSRTISTYLISWISEYSFSLKPYVYPEGDSLSIHPLSPERGLLLKALLYLDINPNQLAKIIANTTFEAADLRGANLAGKVLSGIDLYRADLSKANLSGTILYDANLTRANLKGTNLNQSDLSEATLVRADLNWALMNDADLSFANLDGADLSFSQMSRAQLVNAKIRWANMTGAIVAGADLQNCNIFTTNLSYTNFTGADLNGAILRKSIFEETILTGVDLENAEVESGWLERLAKWKTIGGKKIQSNYITTQSGTVKIPKYFLKSLD